MGLFDDEIRKATVGVDTLGRNIFKSAAEARKFNGIFRDSRGVLREVNGEYAKTRIATEGLGKGFAGASGGAKILTGSLGGLTGAFAGLGIVVAAREVLQFGNESVQAAVKVESFTNAFAALGLGAEGAERFIRRLQEASELPGVQFEQAVQGAVRLRVIGIEGERAVRTITELGNALALTGDTDLSGAIRAITQIIQLQRVNQEEINQLVERSWCCCRPP